jgi:hypothetical protein
MDEPLVRPGDLPNRPEAVAARVASGLVPAWGPIAACGVRLVLAFGAHATVAAAFALSGTADAWEAAAPWMPVWGTAVDLGSLALLAWLLRGEGLRLTDLYRSSALRWSDAGLALGLFLGLGVVGILGGAVGGLLFYGTPTPPPPFHPLPLWAGLYATLVWPLIWGVTEEATYNGYALPRLAARPSGVPVAVAVVAFGWAAQHVALPAHLDLAFAGYRFVSALPVALAASAFYLRTRRLYPLAMAHVVVDALSGSLTLMPA